MQNAPFVGAPLVGARTTLPPATGGHKARPYKGAINGAPTVCLAALLLAGCATKTEPVRVAVPVPCVVQLPQRPVMPTESLPVDAALDDFVAAAAAEIERREGYEVQLRAATRACGGGD